MGSLGLESEGVWGGQGGRFRKAGKRGATENPPARRRESPKLGREGLGLQELSGGGERVSEDGLETRVHLGWVPLDLPERHQCGRTREKRKPRPCHLSVWAGHRATNKQEVTDSSKQRRAQRSAELPVHSQGLVASRFITAFPKPKSISWTGQSPGCKYSHQWPSSQVSCVMGDGGPEEREGGVGTPAPESRHGCGRAPGSIPPVPPLTDVQNQLSLELGLSYHFTNKTMAKFLS